MSEAMKPPKISTGDLVLYHPRIGGPGFLGQVVSDPRLLGETWVVRLGRMEADYAKATGKPAGTGVVCAAACCALTVVHSSRVNELESVLNLLRLHRMGEHFNDPIPDDLLERESALIGYCSKEDERASNDPDLLTRTPEDQPPMVECFTCDGKGEFEVTQLDSSRRMTTCEACHGEGEVLRR